MHGSLPFCIRFVSLALCLSMQHEGFNDIEFGGLDGLIFTAGIGEHAPEIRARICERLGWLGVALDDAANSRGETVISAPESRVTVWVIRSFSHLVRTVALASITGRRWRNGCRSRSGSKGRWCAGIRREHPMVLRNQVMGSTGAMKTALACWSAPRRMATASSSDWPICPGKTSPGRSAGRHWACCC